jgi:alpha-tubulin suppressor-like RCC1 family protein
VPVSTSGVLSGKTLTQITTGTSFTCALSSAGLVYCWGLGTNGQLGNGASVSRSVPVAVSTSGVLSGITVTQVTAGSTFACASGSTGLVYCWGYGVDGELGNNLGATSNVPVAVTTSGVLSGKTITQVSAGSAFACALSSAGLAYCWGLGTSGQLGNSASASSNVPVAVTTSGVLTGLTLSQVSAGAAFACALSSTNAAFCWGLGTNGQLGNNLATTSNTPVAVLVTGVLSGVTLTQIDGGGASACALGSLGAAYCWGAGATGQLGNGLGTSSNAPVAVTTSGELSGVILAQVSVGNNFACALDTNANAYCWGLNSSGQLGNPATGVNLLVPAAVTSQSTMIAAGASHSCMLRNAQAFCWGDNANGDLGNNSTIKSAVPVPVYTGGLLSGLTLIEITVGNTFTCALSAAGLVYCWGLGTSGQLGNGASVSSSVPVAVTTSGVLSGKIVTQISAANDYVCALSSAGTAFCWGDNAYGNLGNGATGGTSNVPVAVSVAGVLSGKTLTQVDSHSVNFACALSSAGLVYCWGLGTSGQLGNSASASSNVPVAVTTTGALSGLIVTQISVGGLSACAVSSTALAFCWGTGTNGQLGNSAILDSNVPVAVTTSGALSGVIVTEITIGYNFACALASTGAAYCWGINTDGALGNGSTTQSSSPVAVTTSGVLSGVTLAQMSSGGFQTCALDSNGIAYCWGLNTAGQVGNPATGVNFLVPTAVTSQATMIATGASHSCMIRGGQAFCWGDNTYGELGDNSTVSSAVPVPVYTGGVLSGKALIQITAGTTFTCALSSVGAVYCWGLGTSGQLGNNLATTSIVPVAVTTSGVLSGLTLTQVSAGGAFACALSSTGLVFCWGYGLDGELGNSASASSNVPVAVTTTGALSGKTVTQLSTGGAFACVLGSAGAAYCWGLGTSGQLGNNLGTTSNVPVAVTAPGTLTQVTAGNASGCALSSLGAASCWGLGTSGQLGNGASTSSNVPVAVTTTGAPSGVTLVQVDGGGTSTCAVSSAGLAYCWGDDTYGELGNNTTTTTPQSTPVAVTASGALSGISVAQVSGGTGFTCALTSTGATSCWGLNTSGQLGNPVTGVNPPVPVAVQAPQPTMIAAGQNHSCEIQSGQAFCWGDNTSGELGNNSTISSTVPVPVYTGGVLTGVTLTEITTGTTYTCALSSTGLLYCWGLGTSGQLGNSASVSSSVPVAVTTSGALSGVIVTQVSAGTADTCALSSAGAAYCWGLGTNGQLGNNSTTASSVPVAVITSGALSGLVVTQIDTGGSFACALASIGTAFCWGLNTNGALGNNSTSQSLVPVAVTTTGTLSGVILSQIAAGSLFTCAASSAGATYCWGAGSSGQLGNNATAQSTTAVAVTATGVLSGVAVVQISAGGAQMCALGGTGGAFCWGLNSSGQVGNPVTGTNFAVPVAVLAQQAVTIAAGQNHSCEIRGGDAYCWGDNSAGELGNGTTINSTVPVAVYTGGVLAGVTLTQIAAGTTYTCALSSTGIPYCWGLGTSGQLGNTPTGSSSVPVAVTMSGALAGLTLTEITAGTADTCALSSAGAAYCWGLGTSGQLGNSASGNSTVPVAVTTSGVLSGASLIQVSAGTADACALSSAGSAYCWGLNTNGQLGNNSTTLSNVPVAVTAASGTALSGQTVTQIDTGTSYACALVGTGAVYCWGLGTSGQLGNSAILSSSVPVAVTTSGVLAGTDLSQIAAGSAFACAASSAGLAYCWGTGTNGQLGNSAILTSNVPVAVTASGVLAGVTLIQITGGGVFACALDNTGAAYCWGQNTSGQLGTPVTSPNFNSPVAVMSQATMIAAGSTHSCLLRNGKAYCWGDDTVGELGNNTTTATPQSTPGAVYTGGVLGGKTLIQITAGTTFTCALASTGAAYCWGLGTSGQLGNGASLSSSVAVLVSGSLTFTQISAGSASACGMTSTGVAYCWGLNANGQLGNNSTTLSNVPVAVTATSGSALFGLLVTQIDAGTDFACALVSTGNAYCWGLNGNGQLGNSSITQSLVPVAVTTTGRLSGVNLIQITAGTADACALGTAGTGFCWGLNTNGQLGNNSTTQSTSAVLVTATATGQLAQITAGTSFACALNVAGAAYCWGLNTNGALGNNSTTQSLVPVAVTATGVLSGVDLAQLSAGQLYTCARDTAGAFYCWGLNSSGQLGNGSTTQSLVPVIVSGITPGPPTGVIATPGDTTATISWTAPASLGTGTLTGYTATATFGSSSFTCSTTSALTCVITGLTDLITYTVTVVTNTTDGSSLPSTSVTVEPVGPLTMTSPTSLTWAGTGNGLNQSKVDSLTADQQLTVADNTATGAGWHIAVSATTFTTGTTTLSNTGTASFTGSILSSVATTAPSVTCVNTCTLPTDSTTYPVAITTAASSPTAFTIYDTAAATGQGVMTIGGSAATNPIGWWVQVPASTRAGTYTSTLTLAMVSGP